MSGFTDFLKFSGKRTEPETSLVLADERPLFRFRSESMNGFVSSTAALQQIPPEDKLSVTWTDKKSGLTTAVTGTNSNVLGLMGHMKTADGNAITVDSASLNENRALKAEVGDLMEKAGVMYSNNVRVERELKKVTSENMELRIVVQSTEGENTELRRMANAMNDEHEVLRVKAKKMMQMLQAFANGDQALVGAMNAQDPTILLEAGSQ